MRGLKCDYKQLPNIVLQRFTCRRERMHFRRQMLQCSAKMMGIRKRVCSRNSPVQIACRVRASISSLAIHSLLRTVRKRSAGSDFRSGLARASSNSTASEAAVVISFATRENTRKGSILRRIRRHFRVFRASNKSIRAIFVSIRRRKSSGGSGEDAPAADAG